MNMEQQTDRAVESATDSAHDAYGVAGEPVWVYTKETWAGVSTTVWRQVSGFSGIVPRRGVDE